VPRYQHFITITRSFLVPDNHKLYYEPCIGRIVDDNEVITQRWLEKLRKLYDPPEDPQASRHSESVSRLKDYLPRMLEKLDLDWDAIISYVVDMVRIKGSFETFSPHTRSCCRLLLKTSIGRFSRLSYLQNLKTYSNFLDSL